MKDEVLSHSDSLPPSSFRLRFPLFGFLFSRWGIMGGMQGFAS